MDFRWTEGLAFLRQFRRIASSQGGPMETKEYINNAIKTESRDFDKIGERLQRVENQRLLFADITSASVS